MSDIRIHGLPLRRWIAPVLLATTSTLPHPCAAQPALAAVVPVEMSWPAYVLIGGLLIFSTILLFVIQQRYRIASRALKDVTTELGSTRHRLVETGQELEQAKNELKATASRYQGILFDAEVGIFQMDLDGKCTYINTALQNLSGLYPKKAFKEGLQTAIHPEDRARFDEAWSVFAKGSDPFELTFRFHHGKGADVHVACRAGRILNAKKEVESYIGWIGDVSAFHGEKRAQQAITHRYEHFVAQTVEGFYQLSATTPIPLSASPAKMAENIMASMVLSDCNDTFSAMYGAIPSDLAGKTIGELKGGCGPFGNAESVKAFVESEYKLIDCETTRQDGSGNHVNLLNHAVGLVEDNKLVAIWGSQLNISQQKRERAELSSQVHFMQRILNTLPADVHVKDTRCRYLYASKKLADRTGIPQADWIGKTIFEVLPATPRDHDHNAIETMKSGKLNRTERAYEARGKAGWMETIQIPMVSDKGLVEGVIGLSLEISDRKKKEEEIRQQARQLESMLKERTEELRTSENECSKTASTLSDTLRKLRIAEAQQSAREQAFQEQLAERKRIEETLRRSEESLLEKQKLLEGSLSQRLDELARETDKRKKWEELLAIKEDELRKIEDHVSGLQEVLDQETALKRQAEANLEANRMELEKYRREAHSLSEGREKELAALEAKHDKAFKGESDARTRAEERLKNAEGQLHQAQEKIRKLTERHAFELEQEVAERKAAAEKLIQNMEELDSLKQQFNERIETETKTIKNELAQRQIREKAVRQHEKELEKRIKELEEVLQAKTREYADQIQAREGAELHSRQVEQRLELMGRRQQELVARETQKLNLSIAEIRLQEVKLRKQVGELQEQKESLEETLQQRDGELAKVTREHGKVESSLAEAQAELKRVASDHSQLLARETQTLRRQIDALHASENGLKGQIETLNKEKQELEGSLKNRSTDLSKAATEYRKVVDAYKALQDRLKQHVEEQDAAIARKTDSLRKEIGQLDETGKVLRAKEAELSVRIDEQQTAIGKLTDNLKAETAKREAREKDLARLQSELEFAQSSAEKQLRDKSRELEMQLREYRQAEEGLKQQLSKAEQTLKQQTAAMETLRLEREHAIKKTVEVDRIVDTLKKDHQAELKKTLAEMRETSRMNSALVDELNDAIQEALNPVIKTTLIMEKAENLSAEQRRNLDNVNHNCRTLVDTMNYRSELTHLADGDGALQKDDCDLHQLMAGIDKQFGHRAETKKLFFAVSFAQYQAANNVPKLVQTDERKLRKILSILVGYAVEQTDKGRLGLHATRKPDSGNGIAVAFELAYTPRDARDRLLDSIFQSGDAEGTVDLKYGLTLARRYIRMMDGEVALEYRDKGVTAIVLQFPFRKAGGGTGAAGQDGAVDEKKAGAA